MVFPGIAEVILATPRVTWNFRPPCVAIYPARHLRAYRRTGRRFLTPQKTPHAALVRCQWKLGASASASTTHSSRFNSSLHSSARNQVIHRRSHLR